MRKPLQCASIVIAMLSLMTIGLMLAGCSGSGGGVSSQVVSGNASVGAPLAGQVSLKDSSAQPQEKTAVIGSDGSFAFDVTGLKAPFIIQGVGNSAGTTYKLHSFANGTGTANVNPLSNALVASAAGVSDPGQVFQAADPAVLQKIKEDLPTATSDLLNKLQPLLKLYGAEGKDPITDSYQSDHQGLDGLFDNVSVAIPNGVITVANAKTGEVIFSASVTDIKSGTFNDNPSTLPQTPAQTDPPEEVTPTPPVTTPPTVTVPAAPANVVASGGTRQVTLSWKAVSSATSYNVYYGTASGITKGSGTKLTNVSSPAVLTGLNDGTTYYCIVTAVNSAGESAASVQVAAATVSATPSPVIPPVPGSVTATGGANQATLTWAASSGATSYNIYWSSTSGVTKANGTRVSGVTSPYVKTGLSAGSTYYFIVTAVNSAGESAASAQVSASTNPPVTKQLSLAWDGVTGASSYNLYWSTSPGVTTSNGKKISGVSSPYTHTGLAAGTTYYYVVTASDGSQESAASAQASGTTGL
ncbi:fibronectin type III domain-containing protein [Geobacter sp. SVR]|uniref:fibronectin type III domain-containing protein n=1 Tax=Geobacter sp. SVR TaxID=2495594 RepID=UPI00143F03AD|nr:fibronectin type III domain-containing protein [Geobacter sp. SVR]BCS52203.1 hypothetical protein GSVR_05110 [Geobacter sp. SVR]GCF85135.1 hypothetical protein GSbR_17350 [Geobacter sp. SVR]